MFEISCLFPLAPGENEVDQIKRIHSVFGTPPAQVGTPASPLPSLFTWLPCALV